MDPTTVTCTGSCTVTLVVTPATATQDQYDAVNVVFACALGALGVIWGAKWVYRLFARPTDA
jgi:hypothetical protein